jgi:hypothetical protein
MCYTRKKSTSPHLHHESQNSHPKSHPNSIYPIRIQRSRSHSVPDSVCKPRMGKAGKLHRTMNAQLSFASSGNHGCGVGGDGCQAEHAPKVCLLLGCWDRARGSTEGSVGKMLGAWEGKIDTSDFGSLRVESRSCLDMFHICFLSVQSLRGSCFA